MAALVLPACTRPELGAEPSGATGTTLATPSTTTAPYGGTTGLGTTASAETSGTSIGSSTGTSEGSSTTHATSTFGTSTSTDSTDSTSTTGPQPNAACADGCAVEFLCTQNWRTEQACVQACEDNLDKAAAFERACAAAWEDLHACLGTLTCEQLLEWTAPVGFPYPCLRQDEVLGFECAGQ